MKGTFKGPMYSTVTPSGKPDKNILWELIYSTKKK